MGILGFMFLLVGRRAAVVSPIPNPQSPILIMNSLKKYTVWTHYEIDPLIIEAASRADALIKGLALVVENPPVIPSREESAWYCSAGVPVESHVWAKRLASPLPEPYARVTAKPRLGFFRY